MELGLQGKKILVTGGTRGIGRGIVLAAARAGARVVTCYRSDTEAADRLGRDLKETGDEHLVIQADVADASQADWLVAAAAEHFDGHIDGIVNNAGTFSRIPFAELPPQEWSRVLDTCLTAAYRVTQQCLPLLGAGSSVVSIGWRGTAEGVSLQAHHSAAKSALIGMTRALARELGPRGIRVNVVAPGKIETEALAAMAAGHAGEIRATFAAKTALGRLGTVDEVASSVLFLLGEASGYITGHTLNVDGGI